MEAYRIEIERNAGNGKKLIAIIDRLDTDSTILTADRIDLTQYAISLINAY